MADSLCKERISLSWGPDIKYSGVLTEANTGWASGHGRDYGMVIADLLHCSIAVVMAKLASV